MCVTGREGVDHDLEDARDTSTHDGGLYTPQGYNIRVCEGAGEGRDGGTPGGAGPSFVFRDGRRGEWSNR